MNGGFEDVAQTEIVFSNEFDELIGRLCAKRSRSVIKVEHRVDDGRYTGLRVTDHIREGRGNLIIEVLYSCHGLFCAPYFKVLRVFADLIISNRIRL